MDGAEFEGTLILELLAAAGKLEAFFDAVDADDTERAALLMRRANVDEPDIAIVIKKMEEGDAEH